MLEEKKDFELNDEELEKVSGGKIRGGNFQVGDWVTSTNSQPGFAPIYYHVNAINGLNFDGTGYMKQVTDNQVICLGNKTCTKMSFHKPSIIPSWLPKL